MFVFLLISIYSFSCIFCQSLTTAELYGSLEESLSYDEIASGKQNYDSNRDDSNQRDDSYEEYNSIFSEDEEKRRIREILQYDRSEPYEIEDYSKSDGNLYSILNCHLYFAKIMIIDSNTSYFCSYC